MLFTVPLRKEVKKLSEILAGEIDFEAPKETQIQLPTTVSVSSCYDIGEIVSLGGLEKLSSHEKYSILKNHFKPYKTYVFRCERSCKIEYLHSSFVYSKKEDAVYCTNFALFSPTDKRRALGSFAHTGYKGWNNIYEKQTLYIGNKYHDDAAKEASGIITKFEEPNNTIPQQTNNTFKER